MSQAARSIDVHPVETSAALDRCLKHLATVNILAVHTEGEAPGPRDTRLDRIYLATDDEVYVIEVASVPHLRPVLELLQDHRRLKVFHDAKRSLHLLAEHFGVDEPLGPGEPLLFDTLLATQLLESTGNHFTASDLLERFGIASPTVREPSDTFTDFRSGDTHLAASLPLLRRILRERLITANLVRVAKLEFDLVPVMAAMERHGIYLNLEAWSKVWASYYARRDELSEELNRTLGRYMEPSLFGTAVFNPDSQPQVLEALHRLGLRLPNTGEQILRTYADQYPEVRSLLAYRTVAKLISSCGELFPRYVHPDTGRIHARYHQIGARTGRMSCSEPNMQQVPRIAAIRACFQAPAENVLITADYSQIELRVAAALSGDERMLRAYGAKEDLHRLTASLISNTPISKVSTEQRQAAKAVNFGLLYAMGAPGLARYAEAQYGVRLSVEQAEAFRQRFFQAYSGLRRWHDAARDLLQRTQGEAVEVRSAAGRRYVFGPGDRLTSLLNSPVQGSAADIMKRAMYRVHHALRPLRGRIIGVIHDELLVEVPEAYGKEAAEVVQKEMEAAGAEFFPSVPFEVDVDVVPSWS